MTRDLRGFTLLEILIVLVILAVLAGLAIPAYQSAVEKSRAQEALTALSATRESMLRYYAISSTYVGATIPAAAAGTLDYNPNLGTTSGQLLLFAYTIPAAAVGTFTILATRVAKAGAPVPPGGPHTISINETGAIVRVGAYV